MRQMQQKQVAAVRKGPVLAVALSLLALAATPVRAEGPAGACSQRYHASLGRIAGEEYRTLKEVHRQRTQGAAASPTPGAATPLSAATSSPKPAEAGLPGSFLFPPMGTGQRTREETAALRFAASLARSKDRSGGGGDADAAWMADRLRVALGDYLTQAPSPYLCSGVEDYVAELRDDARRLGIVPAQREALVAVQKAVAARAVAAALAAMRPVPAPTGKPPAPPSAGSEDQLRPTAGLDRVDMSISTGSTTALPAEDPDLPRRSRTAARFDTAADLVADLDRLMTAVSEGGFLTPAVTARTPVPSAIPAAEYPVLARLAEARPLVTGMRTLVADRAVRLRLATALSSIEVLDYLMRARTQDADPVATAIDATFEAILKAHAADCACPD